MIWALALLLATTGCTSQTVGPTTPAQPCAGVIADEIVVEIFCDAYAADPTAYCRSSSTLSLIATVDRGGRVVDIRRGVCDAGMPDRSESSCAERELRFVESLRFPSPRAACAEISLPTPSACPGPERARALR